MENWQLIAVLLVVALAAGYVAWRTVREWRGKKCGGCGCVKAKDETAANTHSTFIGASELKVRSGRES